MEDFRLLDMSMQKITMDGLNGERHEGSGGLRTIN
jgi:hypothetical protein